MAEPSWKSLPVIKPEKLSEPSWKNLPKRAPSGELLDKQQAPGWFEPGTLSGAAASTAADALQGFGQGASFGLSDEAAGLLAAVSKAPMKAAAFLANATPEQEDELAYKLFGLPPRAAGGPGATGSAYRAVRDQMRGVVEKAQKESPYAFGGGAIAGGIATGIATGAPGAAKPYQTIRSRMLELGKYGALTGAASGLGMSQADLTEGEVAPLAADVASGALTGGTTGAVFGTALDVGPARLAKLTGANRLPIIGGLLPERTIAQVLEDAGLERALRSVLPTAGLSNRLRNKLQTANDEEQRELAKDIVSSGFIKPYERAKDTLKRVEQALEGSGEQIGEFTRRAQQAADYGATAPPSRNYQQLAVDKAMRKAMTTEPSVQAGIPAWRKLTMQVGTDRPSNFLGEAKFPELWQSKSQLQKGVNYSEMAPLEAQMYSKGVQGYARGIFEQLEEALGPQSMLRLREEAKRFRTAKRVEDVLREKASREVQSAPMSLLDLQKAQLIGQAAGGSIGAIAAPILGAIRPYVDPTLASAFLGAAPAARSLTRAISSPLTTTVSGAAGIQARDNAYRALLERFGIAPQSKEELADEAFIRGQTSPDLQPGRQ
ncbi:MAG: hypothetical protein ING90_20855 [Rhodocyclaceae bacterium]|nr:hypothetical protein [Rhodocyclaceae bacterium]